MRQIFKVVESAGFFLKYIDEFIADDFTLLLRIVNSRQFGQETLAGVDFDNFHVEFADKGFHNAFGFAFAE
ncbi:hypothetical protein D1872_268200 [compost metagenome]